MKQKIKCDNCKVKHRRNSLTLINGEFLCNRCIIEREKKISLLLNSGENKND